MQVQVTRNRKRRAKPSAIAARVQPIDASSSVDYCVAPAIFLCFVADLIALAEKEKKLWASG